MSRAVAAGLVAVVTLVALAPLAGVAGTSSDAGAQEAPTSGLAQQGEFDGSEVAITVYENGSARWTFRYFRTGLNETEQEEFQAYADRFTSTETDLYANFKDRARQLTARGTNVTGRQMAAKRFAKDAYLDQFNPERGVVEMSFTWTNFAVVEGDRVTVADVFQGGFYISADQDLVVTAGPGLRVASAEPEPDDEATSGGETRSVTYEGEREFNDRKPKVVFAPSGTGDGSPTDGTGPAGEGGTGVLPLLAVALVVVLGAGAAYAYRSGAVAAVGGGGGGTDAASGSGGGAAATEPAVSDEELLSDEDRVLQLLEDHGGRMKQVDIVAETDWSKSKVSMLLSDMEDDDQISKLRVGRENIVSLSGQEPDAAGSPFDDEE